MGHASGHRPSNSVKSYFGVVDGGGDPSEFLVSIFMCMLKVCWDQRKPLEKFEFWEKMCEDFALDFLGRGVRVLHCNALDFGGKVW